jgi:hypothetical protein
MFKYDLQYYKKKEGGGGQSANETMELLGSWFLISITTDQELFWIVTPCIQVKLYAAKHSSETINL